MAEIASASVVAASRLCAICDTAGLTKAQQGIVDRIVDDIIGKMMQQLEETSLACMSIAEVALMLRDTAGLGSDIESNSLERVIVTAIIGKIAVIFRDKGYCVKYHYGIMVSLI